MRSGPGMTAAEVGPRLSCRLEPVRHQQELGRRFGHHPSRRDVRIDQKRCQTPGLNALPSRRVPCVQRERALQLNLEKSLLLAVLRFRAQRQQSLFGLATRRKLDPPTQLLIRPWRRLRCLKSAAGVNHYQTTTDATRPSPCKGSKPEPGRPPLNPPGAPVDRRLGCAGRRAVRPDRPDDEPPLRRPRLAAGREHRRLAHRIAGSGAGAD